MKEEEIRKWEGKGRRESGKKIRKKKGREVTIAFKFMC